ncbi:MAG TPA: M56 family metallopeptidase [Dongiaceae bacterium]|nr:M56 family metallopeptidase [Dongiaceae bacterium]
MIAARPFARAADRYHVVAAGFVTAALVGPLALAAAVLRPASDGTQPVAAAAAAGTLTVLALPALAVAALVAAMLLFGLACDVVRLRRMKRQAVPLGSVAVRGARIGLSATVTTPTAIGYLHPAVVLPDGFRARVDEREWDAVVAHECAHLARGDDWAKAIQSAVLRIGWWIPGLWLLSRALDLERELASDERAAAETGPRRYAACLLRLATDRADAVAPALWARRSHVAIRVERLIRPTAQGAPVLRAASLGAFTAVAFGVVATAVLTVPGTAPRATATVALRAHPVAHAHATVRHAPARVAVHVRRPQRAPHAKTLAYAAAVPAESTAAAAPAALPVPERPAGSERPVQRIIATVAWRTAHAPAGLPARREPVRSTPAIRPDAGPTETLAFVAPHRKCRTCFGPLRSPDDMPEQSFSPAKTVAGGGAPGAAAIVADDTTSGPVDLGSGLIFYRLPARIQGP